MTGSDYYSLFNGGDTMYVVYNGPTYQTIPQRNAEIPVTIKQYELFRVLYMSKDMTTLFCRNCKGDVLGWPTKFVLQFCEKYDVEAKGLSDDWMMAEEQKKAPKPQLKEDETIVTRGYLETLFIITADYSRKVSENLGIGMAEMMSLFEEWAKDFEKTFKDHDWEDGITDYYDAVDKFADDKYMPLIKKGFSWDEKAVIDLQYIQSVVPRNSSDFFGSNEPDKVRRLAMEFRQYEKNNYINYDNPKQDDFETTVTKWLDRNK